MYLSHFDLSKEPFGPDFEPPFFYRGFQHSAALSFLELAFTAGHAGIALVGPQGTGKSSSLRFAVEVATGGGRLGQLDGLAEDAESFLRSILDAFGFGAVEAGPDELRNLLNVFVVQARQTDQHVVLQIRDPRIPNPEVAEELLWLLHAIASDGGFQVAFTGGEPVERLLRSPRLAALTKRFSQQHRLGPLTGAETQDYLHFRLGIAGCDAPDRILPDDAAAAIHAASRGVPRTINHVADASFTQAARERHPALDPGVVERVSAALGHTPDRRASDGGTRLDIRLENAPYLSFPLGRRKVLIGRHSHNEIHLRDGSVSRHHAMIVPEGQRWVVVDLNSTNGTRVNGKAVHHHALTDGDLIEVGRFHIAFKSHAGPPGPPRGRGPDQRSTIVLSDS